MKFSFSQLKTWLDLSQSPEEIEQALTNMGIEVERRERAAPLKGGFESDDVFTVSLTPNLAHAWCVKGIAQELSTLFDLPLKKEEVVCKEEGELAERKVKVTVEDKEACPFYACRYIEGVRVGPSPDWLVQALDYFGIRSINNIVDITNYAMMEVGQPLHAFDADRVEGREIRVRRATDREEIITIDGKKRDLHHKILVIADAKKPVAIAGIMGGAETEVTTSTRNVILEAALFSPGVVRGGAKALRLQSESSKRFERGIDPKGVERALDQAAELIRELAGGKVGRGRVVVGALKGASAKVVLREKRVSDLLGIPVERGEIENWLRRLRAEFKPVKEGFEVIAPSFRHDLKQEIDWIEEIIRLGVRLVAEDKRETLRL